MMDHISTSRSALGLVVYQARKVILLDRLGLVAWGLACVENLIRVRISYNYVLTDAAESNSSKNCWFDEGSLQYMVP